MGDETSTTQLKVAISGLNDLVATREEVSWFRIDVEFMGKTLSTDKIDDPKKDGKKRLQFHNAFDFPTETVENIEDIVNSTIQFRLIEITREKKKKNDTLIPLGSLSIDPLLLLNGSPSIQETMELIPEQAFLEFQKKKEEEGPSENGNEAEDEEDLEKRKASLVPLPSISFSLETQADLLPSTWNILTCDLKGIIQMPENMQTSLFNFELGDESIPLHISYSDGAMVPAGDNYHFEVDHGDTPRVLDGASVTVAFPQARKRLCLSETRQADLVSTISRLRTTQVQFSKAIPAGGKPPKKVEGENQAEAQIKLTPLLYPGNTSMSCAGMLKALEEDNNTEASQPQPVVEEKEVKEKEKKANKKNKGNATPAPVVESTVREGQAYEDAQTSFIIDINVIRPLILKRTHEEVVSRVTELIPPRRVEPASILAAKKAVENYRDTITGIASDLILEYRQTQAREKTESIDETKEKVISQLGNTGRYEAFKEKIKASVIALIREKFTDVNRFSDAQSRHEFVSKLYVYLTQQMHEMLNKQFSFSQSPEYEEVAISLDLLMDFASENEGLLNFDRAADMWSECVIRFDENVDAWYGYACFSARMGDFSKCEECLRRAIQLNREHTPSLALLGTVLVFEGSSSEGLDLLEAATSYEKESELLWLHRMFLLKYVDPNDCVVEMCNLNAEKQRTKRDSVYNTPFLWVADHFLKLGLIALAQGAVSVDMVENGTSIGVNLILARIAAAEVDTVASPSSKKSEIGLKEGAQQVEEDSASHRTSIHEQQDAILSKKVEEACARIDASLSVRYNEPELWVQLGNIMYENSQYVRAREAFEHAIDLPSITNEHITALRLGDIYIMEEEFELAKTLFLRRCTSKTTSRGWFGLGIACYRLGELGEAEEAFAEANMYDNKNPEIWGYLCLICLRSGRGVEAEQCFKFAAKLNLADENLLNEIKMEMEEAGVESSILSQEGKR